MTLTDTHCHLDHPKFNPDRTEVLRRAAEAGLTRILIPGLSLTSSRSVVKLAESHRGLYAAIGVHPTEAGTWDEAASKELRALVSPHPHPLSRFAGERGRGEGQIVAIGEIGLDYYWDSAPHELQAKVLEEQLTLAAELRLPVILHCREKGDAPDGACTENLLQALEEWVNELRAKKNPLAERPGVLHSFSGTLEKAQAAISLGFFIGVTGPVTYRKDRQELIQQLPLERLLTETDAPYLAPHPQRGKRNEPAYIGLIADKIALLHSCDPMRVASVTSENARRLFGWEESN